MRQTHYFVTPAFRTVIREQSISIQGPKIWDSLPFSMVTETNPVTLKHNVSDYFLASYWNTVVFRTVLVPNRFGFVDVIVATFISCDCLL